MVAATNPRHSLPASALHSQKAKESIRFSQTLPNNRPTRNQHRPPCKIWSRKIFSLFEGKLAKNNTTQQQHRAANGVAFHHPAQGHGSQPSGDKSHTS
jgi:hypothetical protein